MSHRLIAIEATTAKRIAIMARRRGLSIKALASSVLNAYIRRNDKRTGKGGAA